MIVNPQTNYQLSMWTTCRQLMGSCTHPGREEPWLSPRVCPLPTPSRARGEGHTVQTLPSPPSSLLRHDDTLSHDLAACPPSIQGIGYSLYDTAGRGYFSLEIPFLTFPMGSARERQVQSPFLSQNNLDANLIVCTKNPHTRRGVILITS